MTNDKKHSRWSDPATIIVIAVSLVWGASYVAQFTRPGWTVPASLDSLMLLVVSAYITKQTVNHQGKVVAKKEEEVDGE